MPDEDKGLCKTTIDMVIKHNCHVYMNGTISIVMCINCHVNKKTNVKQKQGKNTLHEWNKISCHVNGEKGNNCLHDGRKSIVVQTKKQMK